MSQIFKFNEDVPSVPKADAEPRKGEGKMATDDIQRIMHGLVSDAVQMVDGELSPQREQATDYYLGKPFGNEEDGRSQVVITEVRDSVQAVLPSLLRVFFGPERVVELVPRTAKGVATAQQATDYIQYVFAEDNKGFIKTHDALKDGLVRKIGVFKWYWDEESKRAYREEGISRSELTALAGRDDVELTDIEEVDPTPESEAAELNKEAQAAFVEQKKQYAAAVQQAKQQAMQPPQPGQPPAQPPQLPPAPQKPKMERAYNISYTVRIEGRPCIETVPPEEFLFNRTARDIDSALMIAHRVEKSRGELVAMGIPEEVLDEHGQHDVSLDTNPEAVARNSGVNIAQGVDPDAGDANKKILYVEAYPYLDIDGNGDRELCKVCMIGPGYHVALPPEPVDERPFAVFCPIPEPHTMIGQSDADLTMDLQLTKSSIVRSVLDSLSLSIYPRTTALEGQVNIDDLLNTEIGAIIRTRSRDAVQVLTHPFTGQNALPILEYFETVTENRTQRSKGAMGLDADALQSSTAQAVGAAVQSAQEGTELIARIFAEQALKPLFRGIYKMLVKYRPAARLVRLRGSYVQIDTQQWEADMDVIVNVALGTSNTDKKIAALAMQAGKIEALIQQYGPTNPLAGFPQLREVYARMSELAGIKDTSTLWKPIDPNWEPPAPPAPPPSPEQILAQGQLEVEKLRTEKDLKIKQAELTLKQQQQSFDQELELKRLANDFVLRRYQIDAQYHTKHTEQQLEADARSEEATLQGVLQVHDQMHSHSVDARRIANEEAAAQAVPQEATTEPTQ